MSLEGPRGPELTGQDWKRWAASGEGDSDDCFFLKSPQIEFKFLNRLWASRTGDSDFAARQRAAGSMCTGPAEPTAPVPALWSPLAACHSLRGRRPQAVLRRASLTWGGGSDAPKPRSSARHSHGG